MYIKIFNRILNKKFFTLFCIWFVIHNSVICKAIEQKDPIDLKFEQCIKNPKTTQNFLKCCEQAYRDWDEALNIVYKRLINNPKLNNPKLNKTKIIEAQKAWIKFRDLEFLSIQHLFSTKEGSFWIPIRMLNACNIVRQRVMTLREYLPNISE